MKKSIYDIDMKNKRVLVRADYNVPMINGIIADDTRIKANLPTLEFLIKQKSKIIIVSHLGRPKGIRNFNYTLKPIAERLSNLLNKKVKFVDDCVGEKIHQAINIMNYGDIILLENLRFYEHEEKNDDKFSEKLAKIAEVAVNDAFSVSHRTHASVEGIGKFIPIVTGLLMGKEIKILSKIMNKRIHPYAAIIGGAKISDKIGAIKNLIDKIDILIIGGGMANVFLAAKDYNIGKSLIEKDTIELAKEIINDAQEKNVKLLLPIDVVVSDKFSNESNYETVKIEQIPNNWMILDIGIETVKQYIDALTEAKLIVWNGSMGVFEFSNFATGTIELAKAVANNKGITIIGGGDSISAIKKVGLTDKMYHISTGGGASLEFLEGKLLPGIAVIEKK